MSTGFSFGVKTTAAPTFGSSFGAPATQSQAPGFSFGSNAAAASANPTLFGTSGIAPTSSAPPLFGSAPATGLFGTTPSSSATTSAGTGLTFGLATSSAGPSGLTFGPTTTSLGAPNVSFGLNTTGTSSTAPTLGLGLGSTTTPATTSTLSFGLGGFGANTSTTTTTALSLTPASTASAPVGLGGVATTVQNKNTTISTQKEVPPKEQPLPNEILQTVEAFKDMVKQQKNHSSDIARCSVRDFRRVEQEIDQLSGSLKEIESQLQKNRQLAEKLKYDTANTVQNVEMAQRTHETPPGLQYENIAPLKFFLNLADLFERDMQNLKMQIEAADKYVKNHKNPDSLTPQDLAMGMRRLHETFVALAGRLQSVHSQVESQKETYLNIRKHLLQDNSNPFDKLTKLPEFQVQSAFIHSPPKVASGPTPFNNLALGSLTAGGAQQHTTPPPSYPGTANNTSAGFGAPTFGNNLLTGSQPPNTSLFGNSGFAQNSSFQLDKPPTGSKRRI